MGNETRRTIFDAAFQYTAIAAAIIKEIERTEAKQTVELVCFARLVTREVFTIAVAEKLVAMFHNYLNCICFTGGSQSLSSGKVLNGNGRLLSFNVL